MHELVNQQKIMRSALQIIQKFITGSIQDGIESELARKSLIINLFSTFGVLYLLFFGFKNIYIDNHFIGFAAFFAIIIIILLNAYLRVTKNFNWIIEVHIIFFLFLNLFFLGFSHSDIPTGQMSNSIFVWFYVFPLLSLFLLGLKRGLVYTCILLSLSILLFFIPLDFLPKFAGSDKLLFIVSFFFITLLSVVFEYVRTKTHDKLEKQRTYVEQIVKERTAELEIAKENAEESEKLKTSFLYNLSHEIRTPMNAIVGFSNLLLSEKIDDNLKKEMINHIVSNSNLLLSLVDDIIDISNIESGHLELHYHEVNVRNTMANIYNEFMESKADSEKQHINLIYNLNELPEVSIVSDANRISQILRYLLENAFKFTDKGEIEMGYIIESQDLVKFYIKDTGIGIPKNLGDKIFQRFITGHTNKHKFYRGSGLGLNICKSLVELLGGSIEYTSKVNKGSTFSFTIKNKPENISKNAQALVTDINWDNKTILIAEDEECNYKYLKHLLNKTNATILWANNGQEAVDLASKHDIDLILMDIKMPIMNGLEATKVIKGINKNIPIIAQTAFIYENDEKVSLSSGCDAFIAKPIGKNNLLDLMQRFMK